MRPGPLAAAVRLLALFTLTVPLLLLGALTATPAHAVEPETWVSVSIDQMVPALPQPGGTVRLSGRVTNTSTGDLSNLQVAFWRSLDPLRNTEAMTAALESEANQPIGDRVNGGNVYVNIPSDGDRTLAPGESTRFDLTAQVDDLKLSAVDTNYLIGVHVRGRTDPVGGDITLGRGRIFMPLVTTEPTNALRMTTLVVITSQPSWVRSGVLADDHLAEELSSDGRLRSLLTAAGHENTSFAVDPALVQEIQTMSQGYQVRTSDGQTVAGTGQAAATSWLVELTRLIETGDAFRLPYGNPDIAALVHHQRSDVLQTSSAASASVALTEDLPLLVLPADGRADQSVVEAAEALKPRAIVLSDSSAKGSGPLLRGPGSAPIVTYTSDALQGGPGPAPRNTAVKVRQRMLADTYLEASAAAADSTVGRVRLVTTPQQASAAGPEDSVPWLKPSDLSNLLAGKPSDFDGDYTYSDAARTAELTPSQVDAVDRLQEDYATYADLMVDPDAAVAEQRAVVSRAANSSWRDASDEQQAYLGPIAETLDRIVTQSVELTAAPRVLTTGRDGTFPITVVNRLAADPDAGGEDRNTVDVRIRFDSSNSQRLTVATQQVPGGVAGNASATENVAVQAKTNGTVRVVAQLVTKSGRPVGEPLPIEVNATQAGTTGWIIAIAAGVVLLGTTGLRIRQVTRERAAAATAAGAAPVTVSRPPEDVESGVDRESLDV